MTTTNDGRRIDELLGDGYELVAFRDLPEPHRMAMAWYMAIDGEAWAGVVEDYDGRYGEDPETIETCKRILRERMHVFDERHGSRIFGVATPSMDALLAVMVDDEWARDDGLDAEGIRASRMPGACHSDYPDHGPNDRWPVVLSSYDDEILQDGWHRFASYVKGGHADLPTIFYPSERHFLAKSMTPPAKAPSPGL